MIFLYNIISLNIIPKVIEHLWPKDLLLYESVGAVAIDQFAWGLAHRQWTGYKIATNELQGTLDTR
jgi:hypothetical protein